MYTVAKAPLSGPYIVGGGGGGEVGRATGAVAPASKTDIFPT